MNIEYMFIFIPSSLPLFLPPFLPPFFPWQLPESIPRSIYWFFTITAHTRLLGHTLRSPLVVMYWNKLFLLCKVTYISMVLSLQRFLLCWKSKAWPEYFQLPFCQRGINSTPHPRLHHFGNFFLFCILTAFHTRRCKSGDWASYRRAEEKRGSSKFTVQIAPISNKGNLYLYVFYLISSFSFFLPQS